MTDNQGTPIIARSAKNICLVPAMANRHGLITGATGTGKTVTLQVMAETFSSMGVPVLITDIKGDLSGIANAGKENSKISERISQLGIDSFEFKKFPVCFWDIFGEKGHPLRTTISEMGPILLGRLLNLNEIQSSVLSLVFKIADDNGLLLLDLKDLRKMLEYVGENRSGYTNKYGNISPASIGAVQRGLIMLEEQGGDLFFGEPALDIFDFMQTDPLGSGLINILSAEKLILSPQIYTSFLLWLLSEFFERLPEAGDMAKPKLVFFLDEAHLLFKEAPKVLLEKIEQVVRLIRSKGVGIYFVTQNPLDIPDAVLGQLGNRIQHAMRAFTPKDQKIIKSVSETFRSNPSLDTENVLTELGIGEALVSFLDEKGIPNMVERAMILPPQGQIGPVTGEERNAVIKSSLVYGAYDNLIDRESAYEILQERFGKETEEAQARQDASKQSKNTNEQSGGILGEFSRFAGKSLSRQIGNELGSQLIRGLLGSVLGAPATRKYSKSRKK